MTFRDRRVESIVIIGDGQHYKVLGPGNEKIDPGRPNAQTLKDFRLHYIMTP